MIFSSLARQQMLDGLAAHDYDLLIIGGGITGAGIALDAALRGIKTALVEMNDFASGSSSRSTKLIHGGLRYLKQGEIKEVAELGRERAIVYKNGPHITTPIRMLLPFHKEGTFGKRTTALGLTMYDILARVKKEERKQMLSPAEALKKEPLLKTEGLLGAGEYVEYVTDDARLTLEVLKTAAQKGADVLNYVKAESFIYNTERKVSGAYVKDKLGGRSFSIRAKVVVNAAGPWVDAVRSADDAPLNKKQLQLSKGVHIVIDQSKFPLRHAVYFDAPDSRLIFAIPRDGKTYVGTTDTFYNGDPSTPKAEIEDCEYLLACIKHSFPELHLGMPDIESSWAGVRPLIYEKGKTASEISRRDEIWKSKTGLITIAGGKLTGYRKMAERVVSLVVKRLLLMKRGPFARSSTKSCILSGGAIGAGSQFGNWIKDHAKKASSFGLTAEQGAYVACKYGSNANILYNFSLEAPHTADRLLYAELMYAINDEMAISLSDFFIRRTADLYFNIQRVGSCKKEAAEIMSKVLDWSLEEKEAYEKELERHMKEAAGFKSAVKKF